MGSGLLDSDGSPETLCFEEEGGDGLRIPCWGSQDSVSSVLDSSKTLLKEVRGEQNGHEQNI